MSSFRLWLGCADSCNDELAEPPGDVTDASSETARHNQNPKPAQAPVVPQSWFPKLKIPLTSVMDFLKKTCHDDSDLIRGDILLSMVLRPKLSGAQLLHEARMKYRRLEKT